MKLIDLHESMKFTQDRPHRSLLFDSPNLRVLSFNFEPHQELPMHSHSANSEMAFLVLEGEGVWTGRHEERPARAGQLKIMTAGEPHGLRAKTRVRLLVFIAPTL
jgi:quercetin dioxygenase-like cupin family protein